MPGSCAARPRSTRRTARSSAAGPSARPARSTRKMHHEQNFAVGELHAAATMPFQPYGQLVPSVVRRAALDAAPRPGRRHRRDHAVELPERAGHARRRAGARRRQRRRSSSPIPQTPVCGGAMFEAVFREAGLPDGLLQVVLGDAEVGEAIVTDPNLTRIFVHRLDRGRPAGRRAGRRAAQAGLRSSSAATTRSSSSTTPTSRRRPRAGAFASFQFQGQVCFATGRHIVHRSVADEYIEPARREGARGSALGDPYREDVDLGPDRQRAAARAGRRHRPPVGRRAARGSSRAATHDGLFYRPTVLADVTTEHAGVARGDLRPGRAGRSRSTPTTRRSRWPTTASTASRARVYSRSISRGLALAQRIRAGMVHVNDQTVNDEATIPFGGMGASGQRRPLRRPGQLGRVHPVAVGDRPRRAALVPDPY